MTGAEGKKGMTNGGFLFNCGGIPASFTLSIAMLYDGFVSSVNLFPTLRSAEAVIVGVFIFGVGVGWIIIFRRQLKGRQGSVV